MNIKKVAVIGSGTMGRGIAAQVANAGIPVFLLDLPSAEGSRNQIVENAKENILKSRPPFLIEKSKINLISAGNIEDNFDLVGEADWVIEAVVERIDIKKNIYKKIEQVRKNDSIVSSNTSTIPLKVLSEDMNEEMKKDFCITHFFNPVRYMGLLEIVTESINDQEKIKLLKSFCDEKLGKGVILCKDTPGFLGNRVGMYAIQVAMTEAFKMGLTIEEADAVFGRPMGIPKTGVFGLYDLIGLDLMADVLKSFIKELPKEDPFHEVAQENPLVTKLISKGYIGRKGKGGFYRMNKEGGKKVLEAINLQTREYLPSKKIDLNMNNKIDIQKLISRDDKYGNYAFSVISKIITYAASLIPEITSEHNNIDEAMRLGFNWTMGPFEIFEKIDYLKIINKNKNVIFFKDILDKQNGIFHYGFKQLYLKSNTNTLRKHGNKKLIDSLSNDSANVYLCDGRRGNENYVPGDYAIIEFTTKANTLDQDSMQAIQNTINKYIDLAGIVIINNGMQFSAGVNLNYLMEFVKNKEWSIIEKFIYNFQRTCKLMKHSDIPVVSAPSGLAIGGGFEVVAQSDYVVSHTNVVLGLVETLVGLIPAGGGCKEMLVRWVQERQSNDDPDFAPLKVFDLIGYAKTANSPYEAKSHKFLKSLDKIVINRDRLLYISEKVLGDIYYQGEYVSPPDDKLKLSGKSVRDKMYEILENLYKEKKILDHGVEVGKQLAFVLSGGNTNLNKELRTDDIYALELEAFMNLIQMPKTQERIKHTLETGKPLVN